MSHNYYCLVAGMPEISFDQKKLAFKPEELKNYLNETLQDSDFKLVENLYLEYDNKNILHFILNKETSVDNHQEWFNTLGNLSYEDISSAFKDSEEMNIPYIKQFIEEYNESNTPEHELYWEKRLTQLYYEYLETCGNKFIKEWFSFEFMMKNVVCALISRNHSLSTDQQMIATTEMLQGVAKSSAKDFGISVDWPLVNKITSIFDEPNLMKREENLDMLKWNWLDDATTFEYFSFELVVSILLKLRIIERWCNADPEKGKELFVNLLEQIKQSGKIE